MPVYSDKRVLSLFAVAAAFLMLRRISSSFSRSEEEQDLETIPIAKGALPYVGHLLSFNRIPSQLFAEWQKDVGPVFRVRMGVQTWVIVNESRFAHELLTTNGASTSGRPMQQFSYFYYALGGRGIVFAQANKKWKNTRTAALSILAPNMVAKFSHYHKKENQELIERLIKKTEQEGSVHPTKPICMAAMNFILGTCFGRRNESENDPVFKQVVEMMEKGLKVAGVENDISSFLPILSFLDVLSRRGKFFENHIKNLRDPVMKGLVKGALETYQDNLLKRLNDLKETYDLDDDDLLVTASDLIVAGSDTISGTLTWMLAILLHYPDVQQRICDEIDVFIREHKRLPSFTDRDSFPYTIAVQKECMRYRPVVHLAFLHIVEKKVVIGDYVLPKGTAVLPNAFGMNHDPAIFPEPDKFIPERFLNNTKTMMAAANGKIDNRDHFTFGWGRRLCPGIHLAEVQLFDMFTRLFAKCKVEAPLDSNGKPILPDLDNFQDAGVVVMPPPYKARFILRTDSLLDMISN